MSSGKTVVLGREAPANARVLITLRYISTCAP